MEIPKNLTLDEKIELYKKLSPDDVIQGKYIFNKSAVNVTLRR